MTSNQNERLNGPTTAATRKRRSTAAAKSIRAVLAGAAFATVASFAMASPASADVVRIQQVSSARNVDAWEGDTYDWRAVTWTYQDNNTQLWRMTHVSGNVYTFQQLSNDRYLDAWEDDGHDWNVVTRPLQNNTTQQWLVTDLGGGINYMQQVSSGRYLDAYEDSTNEWRMVTRPFQNNATQQWRITVVIHDLLPVFPLASGILLPSSPPPPPPAVHASGNFTLSAPFSVNMDNGTIGLAGADLNYMAPDLINLQLRPINGAQISFTDGSQRGYAGCSAAAFSTTPVPLTAIAAGNYVCMKTDDGRISEFSVDSIGALLHILSITYTTWE